VIQKVTCKKIQVFGNVTLGRWVRDSIRFEEMLCLQFWQSKWRKTPFIFKIQVVQESFTLQIEGTTFFEMAEATNQRILCNISGKWNPYRHESKNLRFFKNDVSRYRMLSTANLSWRFIFYFEQSLNQHTIKAIYTTVCIKSFHLISPTPSCPVLLINEYRQFVCEKEFLPKDILFHDNI